LNSTPVLLLLGHGSRTLKTREEMQDLAGRLQAASPGLKVMSAFLTLLEPDLAQALAAAVRSGAEDVHVLPLFFFSGKHVLEDIPALILELRSRYPQVRITLREPLGQHPGFFELLRQAGGFA
jgi:sirohydrochlorin cobaltochelatase